MYKKRNTNHSGFTLVEMLVAMAIFVTALTAIASIFTLSGRSARKTQAIQAIQADARFAMEVMAQMSRRGNIDYAYYGGVIGSNPQVVLALVGPSAESIYFRRLEVSGRGVAQISQDGGAVWADLTPPGINITALNFYISPATNPFADAPIVDRQPLVTISLSSQSTTGEGASLAPVFMQTSVASRQYLR